MTSSLISSLTRWLFRSVVLHFHVLVSFPVFLLLLISSFIVVGKDAWYDFNILKFVSGFVT